MKNNLSPSRILKNLRGHMDDLQELNQFAKTNSKVISYAEAKVITDLMMEETDEERELNTAASSVHVRKD